MSRPYRLERLLLSRCLLCDALVQGRRPLCPGCRAGLPWLRDCCPACAMPLDPPDSRCAECQGGPPPFRQAVCAFRYETPVDGLLNRFKHRGRLAEGYWLSRELAETVSARYHENSLAMPELLLPVPLHWRRLQRRGFNQALEIARVLSRRLALPLSTALRRQRHTPSQQGLGREERQRNLAGSFTLGALPPVRRVALVDDVLTTGSTARAVIPLLQARGVEVVDVWAVARTP